MAHGTPGVASWIARDGATLDEFQHAAGTADLVTFDVFDTLIVRFFGEPHDLFAALADTMGLPVGFTQARVVAEQRARQAAAARGQAETTLASIYDELAPALGGLDPGDVASREMALEIACVRPDPQVGAVFSALVAAGRRVVLVSDMYLPARCVGAMLERCGIAGHERLVLSSEAMVAKADGSVWPYVRHATGLPDGARIVHLGDNAHSDGAAARAAGVEPWLLTPPRERKVQSRLVPVGHWLADCFVALLRQDLVARRDEPGFDPYWLAVAHLVVAPAALGMAGFVLRQSRARRTDRVFFLARDGKVFQEAYEAGWRPAGAGPSRYLFCSRRCVNMAGIGAFDEAAMAFLVSGWAEEPAEYLRRVELDPETPEVRAVLNRFFPGPPIPVTQPDERARLVDMMRALEAPILDRAAEERDALLAHLDEQGLYDGPSVVVDLGWHGSLQRSLMALQQARSGHLPPMSGAYLGTFDRVIREAGGQPMDTAGWLFAAGLPRTGLGAVMRSVEVVELLFSAPESGIRRVRRGAAGLEPVRNEDAEEAPRLRLAALFHDVVRRDALALRPVLGDRQVEVLGSLAMSGLDTLLGRPDAQDVAQFAGIVHAEGFGAARYRPIIAPPPPGGARALLRGLDQSFWRGGYLRSLGAGDRAKLAVLAAVQSRVRRGRSMARGIAGRLMARPGKGRE